MVNKNNLAEEPEEKNEKKFQWKRRNLLKALAGIPVLGVFGLEVFRKVNYDNSHNTKKEILDNLGLQDLQSKVQSITSVSGGDTIRIGIIGYGNRGSALMKSLGFMYKNSFYQLKDDEQLKTQARQGNLNVVVTGVCDVFDMHAEKGLAVTGFDIYTEGKLSAKFPAKRYLHYQDMLNDKDIDAVIIATPDHHHARMTIDAIKAGKHVYCEKAPVRREYEIQEWYDVVKNSDRIYQLGHQVPHNAVFQQAREIIDKNLLGQISQIETVTNRNTSAGAWIRHLNANGMPKPGSPKSIDWKQWLGESPYVPFSIQRYYSWARYFDYDTGLFGQLFSHEYDAINQLLHLGIPKSVMASGGQYFYKEFGDIPDVLNTAFEYPDRGFSLTYSANLASAKKRERTIYGRDASMTLGSDVAITADPNSKRYAPFLKKKLIDTSSPMLTIVPGSAKGGGVDAITSATAQYYATRGLTTTQINGQVWDLTYLHLKDWIDCIRNGGTPSANIDKAFEEAVTLCMADISYREKCRTEWDPVNEKIIRC